ncbi:F-box/WD repeat-containing protein [Criblamydia sequanensis]|uniref:Membrane protein n=1 Tax=Candidatus Criblamydia sequanensis CRIB-18 TaxID=1437425 RepID=A0A090D1J6_9BACT|nr:F-box/WD40 repeat-containing protein [Criblamydia sequanensis]CDR33865.1 putative membrane protein [Criblamydia sequanensis CRIB-18]
MNDFISIVNPFSNRYQALEDFNKLTFLNKVTVIFVTTITSILSVLFCTALVFRSLVGRLKPLDTASLAHQSKVANTIGENADSILNRDERGFSLSDEILLHTFSYLDTKSLFMAMQVSKDFRTIGADDTLWMEKTQKIEKELSFYENYLRKNEIAFRIKSPSSQPVVTKITKLINRSDRNTVAHQNFIINSCSIMRVDIYNTKSGVNNRLPVSVVNSLNVHQGELLVGSIGYIEIFELESCQRLRRLEPNDKFLNSPVTGVLVQEGKVFGCYHSHLVVWDLETGVPQKYLSRGHNDKISKILCYDGYVVTYDDQSQVIWDLETESILSQTLSNPLYSYDGKLIALADNNLVLYDFKTQNVESVSFLIPEEQILNSQFNTALVEDQFIIQSCFKIIVGNLRENKLLYNIFPFHGSENIEAKFAKICVCKDKIIASIESGLNSKISCWDLKTGALVYSFPFQKIIAGFVILEEEKAIVCDLIDKLDIFDLEKGVYKRTIHVPEKQKNMFAMTEGKILLDYCSELLLIDFSKEGEEPKPQKGCTLF